MEELELECPCCRAKLTLDRESGFVLTAKAAKKEYQSLQDYVSKERDRNDDLAAKFASAKEKEENKMAMLEKKFQWAKKNVDKLPKAPKPDIHWD